jgi:hypothetical protein
MKSNRAASVTEFRIMFGAVCGRVGLATGAVVYWTVDRAWGLAMGRAVDQAGCDEAPRPRRLPVRYRRCAVTLQEHLRV